MKIINLVFLAVLIAGLIAGYSIGTTTKEKTITKLENPVYKGVVSVYLKKAGSEDWILLSRKENTLTNIGKEWIENQMRNPQSVNKTQWITLSTVSSDCSATATKLANEITSGGLEKAQCSITDLGTGTWSCEYTFTATTSHSNVQVAGLHWNSTAQVDDMLACGTFTSVNLEANDQIKVVWNITISE